MINSSLYTMIRVSRALNDLWPHSTQGAIFSGSTQNLPLIIMITVKIISNEKVTFGHFFNFFFSFSLKMYVFINIFGEFRFWNFWNIHGKLINRLQSIEMQLYSIQIPTKYFKMTYLGLEMTLYNAKWPFQSFSHQNRRFRRHIILIFNKISENFELNLFLAK